MAGHTVDAVVIGSGPNGLVAACMLADAGWNVCLLEAADRLGGAVASAELAPGHQTDLFSAFYPLTAASPLVQAFLSSHEPLAALCWQPVLGSQLSAVQALASSQDTGSAWQPLAGSHVSVVHALPSSQLVGAC